MIIVDVEYVGQRRFVWYRRKPKQLVERVTREVCEEPGALLVLEHLELEEVYYSITTDDFLFAHRRGAFLIRRALRWRDAIARSWFRYCLDLQICGRGERCPWPRWARLGWF